MSPPNARHTAWVCSRRVRSSSAMPIRVSPTLRRLIPSATAAFRITPCSAPTSTVIVSKKRLRLHLEPQALQPLRQPHRLAVDALRDRPQPLRPVKHRIHRRHHREQRLRGADVRGRLLPPDMLLARLQAQPVRPVAARVDRDPDDPPRHRPLQRVPAPPCRPHAARRSPSGTPKRWVEPTATSAPISPGGFRSVSASGSAATQASAPASCSAAIGPAKSRQCAIGARILEDRPEHRRRLEVGEGIADDHLPAVGLRPRADHRDRLRMAVAIDEERRWPSTCAARWQSAIASAAAVASSSSDAFATSSPVRSQTMVWKFSKASSRPWLISG